MKKAEKIVYVNDVHERFEDARNHGGNNNWWFPKAYRIAYNVKMNKFADIETLREYMSDKQNEYYTENTLYRIIEQEQYDIADMLVMDIKMEYELESCFAGRSGGWIEVDYDITLDYIDDDTCTDEIKSYLTEAKKLEKLESDVVKFISDRHISYNKYIDSKEYYEDIIETLLSDEDINSEYEDSIEDLKKKLI